MVNKKIKRRKKKRFSLQALNLVFLIAVLSFASVLIFKIKTNEETLPKYEHLVDTQQEESQSSDKIYENDTEEQETSILPDEVNSIKDEENNGNLSSSENKSDDGNLKNKEFNFIPPENLKSKAVYFLDLKNDRIIYDVNAVDKMYPASLTKIMTALVALENLNDINEPVTIEYEDYTGLFEQNASIAGFLVGETVPAIDLVYAILLPSGAEASAAISRHLFGSEEKFVEEMNKKAQQLGLRGTHYVNTSGLHNEKHFTTPHDVAVLLKTAIENPIFKKIVSTLTYTCAKTTQHPQGLVLYSTLKTQYNIFGITPKFIEGGKTGFTYEAGLCLASFCNKDGEELLLVTMNAPKEENLPYASITDSEKVYENYFDQIAA